MLQQRNETLGLGLGDALIVIDVQNDFLSKGRLPVPEGDRVIEPLNRYIAAFARRGLPVIATRDWHPPAHCSFHDQGGPWPSHCVAGDFGAAFPASLLMPEGLVPIDKATFPQQEDFSGFATDALQAALEREGIDRLFVGGLATEYCVLETVLDGLDRGYAVVVLADAIEALDQRPGDGVRAMQRMADAGARFTSLDQLGL
ncbi:MAG: isochorismatase family protein [Gammaproteobacteria bacterium]|nr:isochorismatase family protein [Gammaproteobacteria bacterium]